MYVYEDNGQSIIVKDICSNLIESYINQIGAGKRISKLRQDSYGDEYFNRAGKRVYLSQLEEIV